MSGNVNKVEPMVRCNTRYVDWVEIDLGLPVEKWQKGERMLSQMVPVSFYTRAEKNTVTGSWELLTREFIPVPEDMRYTFQYTVRISGELESQGPEFIEILKYHSGKVSFNFYAMSGRMVLTNVTQFSNFVGMGDKDEYNKEVEEEEEE
jgi:hypothetical protein